MDASAKLNCSKCELNDRCRDSRKSKRFACTMFVFAEEGKLDKSSREFRKIMRELVSSETVLADNYSIDDRQARLAPNYYRWCVGQDFLASNPAPYPWQLEVGLKLFGDVCPNKKCSDQEWYESIPYDCDYREIPERLQLRKRGVCPKCGKSRLDYINAGRESDFNAYIGLLGQRCVTGDTLVLTTRGITRISDWAEGLSPGWHEAPFRLRGRRWSSNTRELSSAILCNENGTQVRADRVWVSKPERVYHAVVRGGLSVSGTHDHPIKTLAGWTKLGDLRLGDVIPVSYGQRLWGRDSRLTEDLARFIGFWVAEGSGSRSAVHVTNYDDSVRDLCRREMLKLVPDATIKERARAGVDPALGLKRCVGSLDKRLYARVDALVEGLWRKSADKEVPRVVLESPENIVCAFLQALFEGDGSAGRLSIGYASLSKTLIDHVRVLLANLGVITSTRRRMSWATNGTPSQVSKPYWVLKIQGPSLAVFQERVGFFSERKKKALRRAVIRHETLERDVPCWYETYPEPIKQEYLNLIREVDGEWGKFEQHQRSRRIISVGRLAAFRYEVEDWRRLLSSNVALSRSRLVRHRKKIVRSPRWQDLTISTRTKVLAFYEKYLHPNTYWTTVRSVRKSKRSVPTYDFHVPHHHRFMANGLLNHNSGKCVSGSTLVPTKRGLLAIRDVAVDDEVLLEGSSFRVLGTKKTKDQRVVSLVTEWGYELRLTPNHKLLTTTEEEWQRADRVKTVQITSSFLPWGSSDALDFFVEPKRKKLAEQLCTLSQSGARDALQRLLVQRESLSGRSVVLHTYDARIAHGVQQYLLTKRIFCRRIKKLLVLESPWVERYDELFGFTSPSSEYVARNCAAATDQRLGKNACASLYRTMLLVEPVDEWGLPDLLRAAGEYSNVCRAGELTREDARAAADAFEALQVKDGFLRTMLVNRLRAYAKAEVLWDDVAEVTKQPGREDVYDVEVEHVHRFSANGITAHNSSGLGFLWSYQTHQLLKLKNPSAFYGIKAGTILHMNMVGLTYTGVKQAVWDPFMATVSDAPWFKLYHEILDDAAERVGEDELYKIKDGFVFYKNASLWLAPSSPSRRNLRGRTRVFAGVDEMGHFSENQDRVNISGLEVWRALTRSMSTVRPAIRRLRKRGVVGVPQAITVSISSPWEVSDPQMQLFNSSQRPEMRKTMLSVKRPTWEANPDVTFEDLADEFALDPVSAWRDYGCAPPYSTASFVNGIEPFKRVIDRKHKNAVSQRTIAVKPPKKRRRGSETRVAVSARLEFRWEDAVLPKIMAFDAGKMKNSFAVCVAHLDENGELSYDAFVEIRPRHNKPVSFNRVYDDVLVPLVKRMNVRVCISDRWQHEKIVGDLDENYGVIHFPHTLKYGEFQAWRDDLLQGRFTMPRPECTAKEILNVEGSEEEAFDDRPVAQFVRQSIRVVDVPGRTVDKPSIGNDDVFRVGVLAHAGVQLPEVLEILSAGDVSRRGSGGVGAVATGSGGVSNSLRAGNSGVAATASNGSASLR